MDYKDQNYSFEERAADLVSHMTLEEKIMQVGNNSPAIPRLEIPAYNYWSEASHGYFGPMKVQPMNVTSYPVCLAMSQSWDREKMKETAAMISDECRALHNENGIELHMWCPTINLARDPRNGRSDENFGEDPFLAGKLAAQYIKGMQGDDEKYIKTVATPKHYALNSSENNRHTGSSNVDEATLREYYAKVFEYAVKEGKPQSIMTSYNRINGVPASVNDQLLTTLLREEWGFDGAVVSDCGAVADCYSNPMFTAAGPLSHYYCKSLEEASAYSLIAGTDLSCGIEHKKALFNALNQGLITEDIVDRALIRIFATRFKLGLFDDADKVSFSRLGTESVASKAMEDMSVSMANDTIVLLKNDNSLLPLDKTKLKSVLVVGPNAIYRQLGGYSAGQTPVIDTNVNIMALDGIKNELEGSANVSYEKGWCTDAEFKDASIAGMMLPGLSMDDLMIDVFPEGVDRVTFGMSMMAEKRHKTDDPDYRADNEVLFTRALEAAKQADAVIVVAGTDVTTASEENDRETLCLPYDQDEKIKKLIAANQNTVVVLTTLGAITGSFFEDAHTVVNAHFAGQAQGTAIANVLFGNVNPNAKLSATWYRDINDLSHVNDYGIKKQDTCDKKARTYMYFDDPVLFPFGHGLSYTTFEYSNLCTEKTAYDANDTVKVSLDIKNTGTCEGAEVAQLYVSKVIPEKMRDNKPIRQLKGFEKVWLKAGETKTITIELPINDITFWDNFQQKMMIEPGKYTIEAGGSSAALPCSIQIDVTGVWDAPLYNVYAVLDKYVYTVGQQGHIKVSTTLEDTTHLDMSQNRPAFASTDESVVSVNENGIVEAKAAGTASVTATVEYGKKKLSVKLPVVVK